MGLSFLASSLRQHCPFVFRVQDSNCFCCVPQDVTAVLDCVIEEVIEAAVTEVAHAGASYATTALV